MAQEIRGSEADVPPAAARRAPGRRRPRPAPRAPLVRGIGVGRWLGLALLAALVVARVWDPMPVQTLRLRTFDLYQLLRPRELPPQPVAIVDIDEESLAELGQWPWPRTLLADLAARIRDAGAVAIAFDFVFAEPDRMSPDRVADALTGLDADLRARLQRLPTNDKVLARVLRGTRAVLGQSGYPRALGNTSRPVRAAPVATLGGDPRPYLFAFPGIVRNIAELEDAAAGHGMLTLAPERDGVVRRVPGAMTVQGTIVPALVLDLLRVAAGRNAFLVKTDAAGVRAFAVAGVEIPTDRHGRVWVNYARHDPARYLSAREILDGRAAKGSLAGKLVLVGMSATGLFDAISTPLDPVMPGVEVHAQLLETILTGSYLVRPNYALGAELVLTAAVGLLMVGLVPVLGALYTLLLGAAIAAALSAGSWYLYVREGTLLDVAYPLVASLAVYVLLVFVNYFREETLRRRVRGAFSQYLSPELVEQLARHPERLVLGGETKEMTILFCDVRGFTAIAERYKADPQGLTRLMNRLLTPLTDAILGRRGTIDKYMGDAVMAFWNAPLDDARHAAHACESALDMLAALEGLNRARAREAAEAVRTHLPLRVGIGVNSGECVVGNLGSDLHFDYSVLGDAVNLASRLEAQSKTYGVAAVIGAATAGQVAERFALFELDLIRVRGKSEPERIYALLGDGALAGDPAFRALAERNREMQAHYRARRWDAALEAVSACRGLDPGLDLGPFFDLYEARIRAYRAEPPPPAWDGVFEAETK
ncbi:MAG: CHASE2 domain-containing protein [Alphaproteobacteria bacterium]